MGFPVCLSESRWSQRVERDYQRRNYGGEQFEHMTVHGDPPELEREYIRNRRGMNTGRDCQGGRVCSRTTPKGLCPKAKGCCTRLPWEEQRRVPHTQPGRGGRAP